MYPPRFSVILPLYNKAPHVVRAINSALEQSIRPEEIIVVDDASTDGGVDLVQELSDPRIRLFRRTSPGAGGYAARNLAIENASGDWLAFLDADDVWYPNHLAHLSFQLARKPEVGCIATRYLNVYSDHREVSHKSAAFRSAGGEALRFSDFLKVWIRGRECPVWTSATGLRRDIAVEAGLFPAGLAKRGGDKDLWLRACRLAPFVFIDEVTAEFHRDSVNKVTISTPPDTLPIIVETARNLMEAASSKERSLLHRLINMEIEFYARYSFRTERISPLFAENIYLPEGLLAYAQIRIISALPAWLRRQIYDLVKVGTRRFTA